MANSLQILGFEKPPAGQLLSEFLDLSSAQPAAYERCIAYKKEFHRHDRIDLSFPRGSSIVCFEFENPLTQVSVDEDYFMWVPENLDHRLFGKTALYDNFAIFVDRTMLECKDEVIPRGPIKFKRTAILHELVDEYFLRRIV